MTTTQILEAGQAQRSHWLVGSYDAATCSSEVNRIADFYRVESLTAFGTGICEAVGLTIEPVVLVVASQSAAAALVVDETDAVVIETIVASSQ